MWRGIRLTDGIVELRAPRRTDAPELYAAVRASLPELLPWMAWAHPEYSEIEADGVGAPCGAGLRRRHRVPVRRAGGRLGRGARHDRPQRDRPAEPVGQPRLLARGSDRVGEGLVTRSRHARDRLRVLRARARPDRGARRGRQPSAARPSPSGSARCARACCAGACASATTSRTPWSSRSSRDRPILWYRDQGPVNWNPRLGVLPTAGALSPL